MGQIRLQLFGQLSAYRGGTEVRLTPRALTLLGILEAELGRPISRARLIDMIWQSNPTRDTRHSLSQLIYEIRRGLSATIIVAIRTGIYIQDTESDYRAALLGSDLETAREVPSPAEFFCTVDLDNEAFREWRLGKLAAFQRKLLAKSHKALEAARQRQDWASVQRISAVILECDTYDALGWVSKLEALVADGRVSEAIGEVASVRHLYRNDLSLPLPQVIQRVANRLQELLTTSPRVENIPSPDSLPFSGRDGELVTIAATFRRAMRSGLPQMIVLAGQPGIGKSRLIDRAVTPQILSGVEAIFINCEEAHSLDAWDAVRQFVRLCERQSLHSIPDDWQQAILPLLDRRGSSTERRPDLQAAPIREGCAQLLRARSAKANCLAVVIDDLQWIDPASLKAIEYMIAKVASRAIVWCLSTRNEGLTTASHLSAAFRRVAETTPVNITLEPLSEEEVKEVMDRSRLGGKLEADEQRAFAYSGGNPFLLGLWVSSRAAGRLPDEDLEAWPTADLAPSDRRVCNALAVLGGRTGLAVLQEVSGLNGPAFAEVVERLVVLNIVRRTSATAEFKHDLVRERVLALLPQAVAEQTHIRALTVLKRISRRSATALAKHAIGSGDPSMASSYALEAADECVSFGAQEEAEFFLRVAVDCAQTPNTRAAALRAFGEFLIVNDRVSEAKQCFDQLRREDIPSVDLGLTRRYLELRLELNAGSTNVAALVQRSLALMFDLAKHERKELLGQAIAAAVELAHDAGDRDVIQMAVAQIDASWLSFASCDRALLAGLASRINAVYGDLRTAHLWADRSLAAARSVNDELAVLRALIAKGTAQLQSGYVNEALDSFRHAMHLSRSPRTFHYRQRILNNYGVALIEANQLSEASDAFREGIGGASVHDLLFLIGNLAYTDLLLGRREDAIKRARLLAGMNSMFEASWVSAFCVALEAAARRGDARRIVQTPSVSHRVESLAAHEIVVRWSFESLFRIDRQAAIAAAHLRWKALRGRDFLGRVRVLLLLNEFNRKPGIERSLERLARWTRRRGALRIAEEITLFLNRPAPT